MGYLDKALKLYDKSLEINMSLNNNPQKITCLLNIAINLSEQNNFDESKKYLKRAILLTKKFNLSHFFGKIFTISGQIYFDRGKCKKSLVKLKKAKKVGIKYNSFHIIAESTLLIGIVYLNLKKYEKSFKIILKAKRIYYRLNDSIGKIKCLFYLARCYEETNNFIHAYKLYERVYRKIKKKKLYHSKLLKQIRLKVNALKGHMLES